MPSLCPYARNTGYRAFLDQRSDRPGQSIVIIKYPHAYLAVPFSPLDKSYVSENLGWGNKYDSVTCPELVSFFPLLVLIYVLFTRNTHLITMLKMLILLQLRGLLCWSWSTALILIRSAQERAHCTGGSLDHRALALCRILQIGCYQHARVRGHPWPLICK